MIEEVTLENFKGFKTHTIPLRPLTMIVGANNAGKSTVVEALRLVAFVIRAIPRSQMIAEPPWLDHEEAFRGISPRVRARGIEFDHDSFFYRYEPPPAVVRARFVSGAGVTVFIGRDGDIHGVIKDAGGHAVGTSRAARALDLPRIAVQPQVAPLLRRERVLLRETVDRGEGTYLASQHFRNQLKYFKDHFSAFCELAARTWPNFRIYEFNGDRVDQGDQLVLNVQHKDFVAEASWMGHGLQMWLQTMWFLSRTPADACVILDEPDVFMHPDIQHRLLQEIRGRFAQLLVTTHSVELMASVNPADILVLDPERLSSGFATSLPAVQAVIDEIGGIHNLQLTRLWSADRFLLVEGNDLEFLRIFERSLRIRPSFSDVVPHGSTGGWGGWSLAITSKLPVRNNAGGKIVSYAIFDADHHAQAEIDQRYKEADSRGVRLHVWHRKEIENYLLVPSAIARHVSARVGGGTGLAASDVEAKIVEFAGLMRDEVEIDLAEKLFQLDRSDHAKALRLAKSEVREAYASLQGIVRIVPGKRMVKDLSKWMDATHGVTFGPMQLAYELQPEEIDGEVRVVLEAIAARRKFPEALRVRGF